MDRETQPDRNQEEGGKEFGDDIYSTGERNPWEFSSLAYESNSNSRKKQTFSSELLGIPAAEDQNHRSQVQGSELILPW